MDWSSFFQTCPPDSRTGPRSFMNLGPVRFFLLKFFKDMATGLPEMDLGPELRHFCYTGVDWHLT